MNDQVTINQIIEAVGGRDNIKNFEHCATRLRIILRDEKKFDQQKAEAVSEAKGYFFNTGQHQFIFGTGKVNQVFRAFEQEMGTNQQVKEDDFKDDVYQQLNPVQRVVRILADILVPLIPVLVTTGLLMGIRGLLLELGMNLSDEALTIFQMLTDTAFAFLPVLIVYSAARKFGGNPLIGIVVGLMLVAPQLPNAWAVVDGSVEPLSIFGIDVIGYQGSIIPAIAAGYLVAKLEKGLRKIVPQVMDLVLTPFLTITVTIAAMLFVLGPILQLIESGVIGFIISILEAPFGLGYVVFGALQQLLTITGLHHSLSIIEINLLNETGLNVIQTLITVSMAGQFGAAIAASLLIKDKVKRTNALSSTASTLFGITEPLLFGVNLRHFRIFVSGMVGGAIGGLITYLLGLKATGMGITFIPGLLLYTSRISALIQYILVIAVSFAIGFVLVRIQSNKIKNEMN
ncbi:PTS system, sucrose-specific IIC component [Amphibacillus marinus]|uniref:PTS system, sucrose-specific IIC component n=1 Tax=Amphibacillus marinus TaxID=872970 RepID=A0A1H8Q667_9BACI|nr:PTS transporter subunit EIIC [Amphibacillus marinus]SEO49709.1 PTS system, sucrose-specific IIC component [Amphibacillus marinus]